jgi:hypothetical protein
LIACILYLLLLFWLIRHNGFFGLFNDSGISKKKFAVLFLLKTLAIPVFYLVYQKIYGGIEKFDSGKFYNDVKIINGIARTDIALYFKLLLGLQDDNPKSYDFLMLSDTMNWDNGAIKDFFYNDNRVLIRIHSVLHFIAFGSYFVHALFDCFLSFVGINFIYKTFKEFFYGKEFAMLVILCFFPALWFYTGALLKEGITLFILGCTLYQSKKLIYGSFRLIGMIWLMFLLFVSCLLKPYLLFFAAVYFSAFFIIYRLKANHKTIAFFSTIILFLFALNFSSRFAKHKSLKQAAVERQRIFAGVSKGGIFLYNNSRFIRIEYGSSQIKKVAHHPDKYTIKKNIPFMYWKSGSQDTLYCRANQDTLSAYDLAYIIPASNSNIAPPSGSQNIGTFLFYSLYYTLAYPFFINVKSVLLLASFENLIILFSLIAVIIGFIKNKKEKFLPLAFLFFALLICLLIGATTPNSGAIFRYRGPAVVFILLSALYYIEPFKSKHRIKI